jgi:hypothetical protein
MASRRTKKGLGLAKEPQVAVDRTGDVPMSKERGNQTKMRMMIK